jgi:cation diffusion facilitator family transporter
MTDVNVHTHDHEHHEHDHDHHHDHEHHEHDHDHGHDHHHDDTNLIWAIIADALHLPSSGHTHDHTELAQDPAMRDNELGIRTVKLAFVALGVTTLLQIIIYLTSGSVALLADTVHNLGDALNSVPLWIAFVLARRAANKRYTYGYGRAEDIAGLLIILSIGFSALYILWESLQKLIHPEPLTNLGAVALAAVIGFVGNEIVAGLQIRVGNQIGSEAMIADGWHARTDGFTSLAVLVAVIGTALGAPIADPLIGLVMGVTILLITRSTAAAMWYRLMDAVDPALVEKTEAVIREHDEISAVQQVQMRWLGHRLYAEIVLAVDQSLTTAQSEAIIDHISHHLYHLFPALAHATIAVVPASGNYGTEAAHHRGAA